MSRYDDAFRSLLNLNMGLKNGERLLVFTDSVRAEEDISSAEKNRRDELSEVASLLAQFAETNYGNTFFTSFPSTPSSGSEPPEKLWEMTFGTSAVDKLKKNQILASLINKLADPAQISLAEQIISEHRDESADVIIALSNNSTSHTSYRKLACHAGARFASLPHFEASMFFGSMLADLDLIKSRTDAVADAVNKVQILEVSTEDGTNLFIDKTGRRGEGDYGLLDYPGSFGNLPAGEVYLAPLEGKCHGEMVIRYAPTHQLDSPLKLIVKDGEVKEIIGDDPYREILEKRFAINSLNRNIAELGIGTNDKATRADNVLEAEKILGTVHVALGDNSGFGGKVCTPFHEDYVLFKPTLTAIDSAGNRTVILKRGELLL